MPSRLFPNCPPCSELRREYIALADEVISAAGALRMVMKSGDDVEIAAKLNAVEAGNQALASLRRRMERHLAETHPTKT